MGSGKRGKPFLPNKHKGGWCGGGETSGKKGGIVVGKGKEEEIDLRIV